MVATPPRAADTNDPVTIVGAAAAGGSNGGGASGAPTPVIVTRGTAVDGRESSTVPNAYAPAAPTAAPAPSRSIARRLSCDMPDIMPSAVQANCCSR